VVFVFGGPQKNGMFVFGFFVFFVFGVKKGENQKTFWSRKVNKKKKKKKKKKNTPKKT